MKRGVNKNHMIKKESQVYYSKAYKTTQASHSPFNLSKDLLWGECRLLRRSMLLLETQSPSMLLIPNHSSILFSESSEHDMGSEGRRTDANIGCGGIGEIELEHIYRENLHDKLKVCSFPILI